MVLAFRAENPRKTPLLSCRKFDICISIVLLLWMTLLLWRNKLNQSYCIINIFFSFDCRFQGLCWKIISSRVPNTNCLVYYTESQFHRSVLKFQIQIVCPLYTYVAEISQELTFVLYSRWEDTVVFRLLWELLRQTKCLKWCEMLIAEVGTESTLLLMNRIQFPSSTNTAADVRLDLSAQIT